MKTASIGVIRKPLRIGVNAIAIALTLGFFFTPAHAGNFMKAYMNGDVDCDVSSSKTYTHAYDINAGTGDLVINGVTFTGIDGLNSEPGASDFTTTGFSGNINTYTGDLPASSNVSGQMGELTSGFNFCLYDSTPDGTLTLTGLEVGKTYATTLYNMTWDSVTRPVDITTSEGDAFSFDENYNRNGGTADGVGNVLVYYYTATDTNMTMNFDAQGINFHLFGFSNEEFDVNTGSFAMTPCTGDEDCGISSAKAYTHAYNIDDGVVDLTINGVAITGIDGSLGNPSASNFSTTGFTGNINSLTGDLTPSENISGAIAELASGFNYGPDPYNEDHTVTLADLEVGQKYTLTFYNMTWGELGNRAFEVTTSLGDRCLFDENFNSNDESGNGMGNLFSYTYTATDTSMTMNFSLIAGSTYGFHFSGFTNELESEQIAGDANGDGKVDGSDVTILAGNWQKGVSDGLTAKWEEGDFNGDGKVDGSDVTILAGNWQYGVTAAAASVPEPSTILLLFTALAALCVCRKMKS